MTSEVKYMYFKSHPLTCCLADEKIKQLSESAKLKTFHKGESIYMTDSFESRIYLLMKGNVKLSEVDDRGDEMIKEIMNEGEVFGDLSLDGNMPEDEFAEVLVENVIVCSFRSQEFKMILESDPLLAVNYALRVGGKLRRLENKHYNLVFRNAKSRLIHFFKDWAKREGNRVGDKVVLNNYLTHSDIAGFISTSRQSVTVLLNELKDTGLLCYNRKKIEINNLQLLN